MDELVINDRDLTAEELQGTHQELRPGLSARQYLKCPCPSPGEILMQDDVVALFAYDHWANTKVLEACRKLTAEQYVAEPKRATSASSRLVDFSAR
jgi:hypothetical protein